MIRAIMLAMACACLLALPVPVAAAPDHGIGAHYGGPPLLAEPRLSRRSYRGKRYSRHYRKAAPRASGGLTTISCGGKPVKVSSSAAANFAGFCRELAATGYRIRAVGGWRAGTCATNSRHPCGLAIDINQTARNVCLGGCPSGVNAMARRHGLLHGAEWRHADAGHFEKLDKYSLARINEEPPLVVERPHPLLGKLASVLSAIGEFATGNEYEPEPARAYLVRTATVGRTMAKQTPELTMGLLHPRFAERLAGALREARAAGLPHAACFSAYRMPVWGIGGYRNKFDSNHAYGLACDIAGIGRPRSATANQWHKIASRHGLYNPYRGTRAERWEWNHYQVTPTVKAVAAVPALRRTITAKGPRDPAEMWKLAGSLIDRNVSGGRRYARHSRVRYAAAR